jgi:hypothetical protein
MEYGDLLIQGKNGRGGGIKMSVEHVAGPVALYLCGLMVVIILVAAWGQMKQNSKG